MFLPVDDSLLEAAEPDDHLDLHLPGGRIRKLRIVQKEAGFCWAECLHSGYGETGMPVTLRDKHKKKASGTIGVLPPLEEPLRLRRGDTLVVTGQNEEGRQAANAAACPHPLHAASGLSLCEKRDRIAFDDGKIDGTARKITAEHLEVEITRADPDGSKLSADKGINFPDSDPQLPAMCCCCTRNSKRVAAATPVSF